MGLIQGIEGLGRAGLLVFENLGRAALLLWGALAGKPNFSKGGRRLLQQIYSVGVLSLPIIVLSGLFIGMVLGLQGYTILSRFAAEQALGQMIALSMVRELGPVIGGLLFIGCACSTLTAEISLRKTTEQLASLEMMAVDPLRYIIAPRFWAGQISLPLLTLIFNVVAIFGGYWVGSVWLGVDSGAFWANMQSSVNFHTDIVNGLIKSVVFGAVSTWIAVFHGMNCAPTAEGIGRATTQTVIHASLAILCLDFFLTAVMFGGGS